MVRLLGSLLLFAAPSRSCASCLSLVGAESWGLLLNPTAGRQERTTPACVTPACVRVGEQGACAAMFLPRA